MLTPAWSEAISEFAGWLDGTERSDATQEGYLKHIGWLAGDSLSPWTLRTASLQEWIDGHNWSQDTRRKVLVSLRCFYAWAVANGKCAWAPTAGLASAEPRRRGSKRNPIPVGWVDALSEFSQWQRSASISESTIDVRRHYLRRLGEVCADPWDVTPQQLATWLSSPDWAAETKRSARSSLTAFYRWAATTGRVEASPAEDLARVRLSRSLPRPTPEGAVVRALEEGDDRARLAIMLAALAGLRRAEIARLHSNDVGELDLRITGKGGHQRFVPLHPVLAEELRTEQLRRLAGTHGTGWSDRWTTWPGWIFPSDGADVPLTPAHMGKVISGLLPPGWTTHTLRHRFATSAYVAERDLRAVQQLLGHAKPETTARYAAVPDGALRTAVAGVGFADSGASGTSVNFPQRRF